MGFKFRRSFKLAPGVKINLSHRGISTRIGGRGMSITTGRRGTRLNAGIPGTGISYSTRLGGGSRRRRSSSHPTRSAANTSTVQSAPKSQMKAFLLCLFFGIFGAHWFYLGRSGKGLLYLCTLGLGCVGWLIDTFRLFLGLVMKKQ